MPQWIATCSRRCLKEAVDRSFNAITVDGDTSTNDACVLAAAGTLGNPAHRRSDGADGAYSGPPAVIDVCQELATAIIRDGEGATKLVAILIEEAATRPRPGGWPTPSPTRPWSRPRCSPPTPTGGASLRPSGRAGVDGLDIDRVRIWLGDTLIVSDGGRAADYTEAAGRAIMEQPEIQIRSPSVAVRPRPGS